MNNDLYYINDFAFSFNTTLKEFWIILTFLNNVIFKIHFKHFSSFGILISDFLVSLISLFDTVSSVFFPLQIFLFFGFGALVIKRMVCSFTLSV